MTKKYVPKPTDVSDIELTDTLTSLTEIIAENVHDVWAKARMEEGWTYGNERNDIKKTHPGLVSYTQLSESEKDYDRNTAINTLKLIIKLGYEIRKH